MKKYPELVVYALDGGVQSYIVEQAATGKLPGFRRALKNGTVLDDCRPPFPSITPTCWAGFSTGTTPDIHGITDQDILMPGSSPDRLATGYSGYNLLAERFWEAAAKIDKKSLVLNLPTAGPNIAAGVRYFCMANRGEPDQRTVPVPVDISDQLYVFDADTSNFFSADKQIPTPSGQWQPQIALKPSGYRAGKDGCVLLQVETKNDRENPSHIEPFCWAMRRENMGVRIAFSEEALSVGGGFTLSPGKWLDTIRRSLKNDNGIQDYGFRFKMIPGDIPGAFAIYITPATDLMTVAAPPEFAEHLIGMENIPADNFYGRFLPREGCLDTALECTQFNFDWHKEVVADAMEHDPFDILISYHVQLDSINHMYRSVFEGVAAASEAEKSTAIEAFDRFYKQADDFLCWLYDHVIGPDTALLIVSDHGAVGFNKVLNPLDALEKAGLAVRSDKTDPWGLPLADVKRSHAIPVGCGFVYVNLKGRFSEGIVETEDYDKTVGEIIAALQMHYRDPETGENALAFAVENRQAGFVGQGGSRSGDVVFGLSGGKAGGFIGGVHACQMPTAKSKTGAINALCILSGKAFGQELHLSRSANLYDLAPTLCHALGYPQPTQATGAILFQALKM